MGKEWKYDSGDWWLACDVCAKKIKASDAKHRWDGYLVCPEDYEERHSLDFIRARSDKIRVPYIRLPVDEFTDELLCTIPGRHAYPLFAIAGCMIAGFNVYSPEGLFTDFICTPEGRLAKADQGTADCATIGLD
jgi:hypothetical protein